MYQANLDTYKEDNLLLGIKENQRPIMIMVKMDSTLENNLLTLKVNKEINDYKEEISPASAEKATVEPLLDDKLESVELKKDPVITKKVNELTKGSLKVYIQYGDKTKESEVNDFANQLKDFYVIPPIDYVENKSGYGNEIRYYRRSDKILADTLLKRI